MAVELRDPATGLWSDAFFYASVDTRVATARRELRPLSVTTMAVASLLSIEAVGRAVADACAESLRECDVVARLDGDVFGLLFEGTSEAGTVLCINRVRSLLGDNGTTNVVWAGVAIWPTHGLDAPTLLASSLDALADARKWTTSRTEIALGG